MEIHKYAVYSPNLKVYIIKLKMSLNQFQFTSQFSGTIVGVSVQMHLK